MSERYRIKNCPAYIHRPLNNHDRVCLLGDKVKPNHKELYVYCQDCTDCVLKQIVEKCKRTLSINKGSENEFTLGKITFAEFILKDLDIEECEK